MRTAVALGIALLALAAAWAAPGGGQDVALPTTYTQDIAHFQVVCNADHGFKTFSKQVWCIKELIAHSGDYGSQPEVTLYALTADKLVDDVRTGRLSPAAARVELQRAYLEVLDRERALGADQQARAAREEQAQAAAEQERRAAAEAEAAREAAEHQQASERAAAVQNCIEQVRARQAALNRSQGALGQINQGLYGGTNPAAERNCSANPNAYQAIPLPPRQTRCSGDGYAYPGSTNMDVDLTCTTQ
jgi:hypothetical protein